MKTGKNHPCIHSDIKLGKKGFTLIEIVVTLLIIGVLAAFLVPSYISYIEKSRAGVDTFTLGVLNEATRDYLADNPSQSLFDTVGVTDDALMQLLVDSGILPEKPSPKQEGFVFTWIRTQQLWILVHELKSTEIIMGSGGFTNMITGGYTGSATQIMIPKAIDGVSVSAIYQDAFSGKGLTSVLFSDDSSVSRIHARAFMNNDLTEIILPSTIKRLDYGAFLNNFNLTKVTIGDGVEMEGRVFQNSNTFYDAYTKGGAGTYIYDDGVWIKQ